MSGRPLDPTTPDHSILLIVSYDGGSFCGFARQPKDRTVQGVLERCIAEMNGEHVDTKGAGRTDAGVHAMGQAVSFDPSRTIAPAGWVRGLNAALDDDVVVLAAAVRPRGYNPRFDSVGKMYRYLLQLSLHRDPLWRGRAWWLPASRQRRTEEGGLDLAAMREAASRWIGTHDFQAFRQADDDRVVTQRRMDRIELIEGWANEPSLIAVEVEGSAFMKNMVRIMVGTLVEVGRGKMTPDEAQALLGPNGRREDAGTTAPAHGLTLVEVHLGRPVPPA